MKVLVFAPHPDDDILGCGGTIAKHVKHGHEVKIVYMTSGNKDWLGQQSEVLAKIREAEARQACGALGVDQKNLVFFQKPDGALKFSPEDCTDLARLIREVKPEVVFAPKKDEEHPDHVETYKLVEKALIKAGDSLYKPKGLGVWKPKVVLCYEVWPMLEETNIRCVVDITSYLEAKIKAGEAHYSQNSYSDNAKGDSLLRMLKNMPYYRVRSGWKGAPPCECFDIMSLK